MPVSVLVAKPPFCSRTVFLRRAALAVVALFACFALNACTGGSSGTTPPPPDTTPPTAPTSLTATAASSTQINLSWTGSTDNVGVTGYQIQRCQNAACSNFAQVGITTTAVTFNDTGLTASTSYSYRVSAKDAANNVSAFSNTATASTPAGADTTPPTAPTNLTATGVSSTQINLSWTASTDNVGVTGYQIQRCQGANCSKFTNLNAPVTTTTFSDTTVVVATSYSYRVSAKDAANNVSAFSNTATAIPPDTTPPTAPTNLTATAASSTQINLAWTASTDNVGVAGYQIQRCQNAACANFANLGAPVTTTTFNDTGLTASTSYSYRVSAKDVANNVSPFSNIASATTQAGSSITVSVSPRRASVTTSQPQQFSAAVTGSANTSVTWEIDGTLGGSTTTLGTIDATGKYTPPATGTIPGAHVVAARSAADTTVTGTASVAVTDLAAVSTYQNDSQRTGQNQQEYALTPSIVSAANFGKRFSCDTTEGNTVPGHVYAQPLYVANLSIGGVKHNVFFVVTESDWVYAFDADGGANGTTCTVLWKASMLDSTSMPPHDPIPSETTVPAADTGETGDLIPEIGITSTPVIDLASAGTPTLYLTSKSKESNTAYHHRLHALDVTTGAEKFGGPMEIMATAPGTGFVFDPLNHMQRPALLLSGNNIYLGFGSHGDHAPNYHGWLLGYNKTTLAQSSVWVSTDTSAMGTLGAIWQAGAGPAVDANGNIWVEIANGDFDTGPGTRLNYGDSVVKLNPAGTAVLDFFTPSNQDALRAADTDLGSAGVTILPDGFGNATHLHLAVATGKPNILYLLDQGNLGQFNSTSDNAIQELTLPNGPFNGVIGGMFSKAAYFNGRIYVVPIDDVFQAYSIANAHLTALVPVGTDTFGFPGATPAVSSQGASTNGIVWALNTNKNDTPNGFGTSGPAVLFAYDAATLAKLYSSPTSGAGAAVNAIKFVVPTIANGRVYVAGNGAITVFGLLP
jgi:chitodextrinase